MSIKEEPKSASIETPSPGNSRPGIHDPRVQIVIEFMAANLHRRISTGDFGREVRLSPAHVTRLFTEETGIPPGEYLIRLRIERAAHLLLNRLLSVKEVMTMCGYANRGHFLQHFKRYFGLAPSEYWKKVRGS
jgi:AraC family transcriptional regulator